MVVDQRPDGLIKGCPKTLKQIPKDQEDVHMGLFKSDLVSNPVHLGFLLRDDSVGLFTEFRNFLAEGIQVTLCPLGLPVSIG